MVTDFFVPQLAGINLADKWFQQDGATYHTARDTINLLKETVGEGILSRNGPVNWPSRPCDLTPLKYFLWEYGMSSHLSTPINQRRLNI